MSRSNDTDLLSDVDGDSPTHDSLTAKVCVVLVVCLRFNFKYGIQEDTEADLTDIPDEKDDEEEEEEEQEEEEQQQSGN